MAFYRIISMDFWNDTKVIDNFTPEDKYFYLYLMTNPHTNTAGCYEISQKTIANETGYNSDTVTKLLQRFQYYHNVIQYCNDTKEILLLNWHKYNWTTSDKLRKLIFKEISTIKQPIFRNYLLEIFNGNDNPVLCGYPIDTVSIPYGYTNTNTNTKYNYIYSPAEERFNTANDTVGDTVDDTLAVLQGSTVSIGQEQSTESIKSIENCDTARTDTARTDTARTDTARTDTAVSSQIIDYLNEKLNTNYKHNTQKTLKLINARLKEGFTLEDFKTVIDNKYNDWSHDDKMKDYLRPITLFSNKFESYLNEIKTDGFDDKFSKAWNITEKLYRRKEKIGEARSTWFALIMRTPKDQQIEQATNIYNALSLYLKNYNATHDDDDYRYLPTLKNWLDSESSYWVDKYKEIKNERS